MRTIISLYWTAAACSLTVLLTLGCAKKPPEVVPVQGILTLDSLPLENAEVKFYPSTPGVDGNYIASGVTDANGRFVLKLVGSQANGACIGNNQVTVTEGPIPDELRGGSEEAQKAVFAYRESQKNRPIPSGYSNLVQSGLVVEVVKGQSDYKIELSR